MGNVTRKSLIRLVFQTAVVTALFTSLPAYADPITQSSKLQKAVQSSLSEAGNTKGFSGTITAYAGGVEIFELTTGLADKETNRPITTNTFFNGASTSKLFTAYLLQKELSAKGHGFDTKVNELLPNLSVSDDLTIKNLLRHETDIGHIMLSNFTSEERLNAKTNNAFYELISGYINSPISPLTNRAQYRNENYIIAGQIIEKLSGKSFEDALLELAKKSGAEEQLYIGKRSDIIDSATLPYVPEGFDPTHMRDPRKRKILHTEYPNVYLSPLGEQNTSAAGGLYVTSPGFIKISEYIANQNETFEQLCLVDKIRQQKSPRRVRGVGCIGSLFGGEKNNKYVSVGHGGGAPGISTLIYFYPDFDITLTVLSNHHGRALPIKESLEKALGSL